MNTRLFRLDCQDRTHICEKFVNFASKNKYFKEILINECIVNLFTLNTKQHLTPKNPIHFVII